VRSRHTSSVGSSGRRADLDVLPRGGTSATRRAGHLYPAPPTERPTARLAPPRSDPSTGRPTMTRARAGLGGCSPTAMVSRRKHCRVSDPYRTVRGVDANEWMSRAMVEGQRFLEYGANIARRTRSRCRPRPSSTRGGSDGARGAGRPVGSSRPAGGGRARLRHGEGPSRQGAPTGT
jgi:hypothetical protein